MFIARRFHDGEIRSEDMRTGCEGQIPRFLVCAFRSIAGLALLCLFASGLTAPAQAQQTQPVVASDDTGPEVRFGGHVTIQTSSLLANDRDGSGRMLSEELTVTDVSAPQQGTVILSEDGYSTIIFTHDGTSNLLRYAFTYTVSDSDTGGFDTAVVSGTVRPTWADDPALSNVRANPASIKLGESSALQWTPREDVAKVVVKLPDGTTKEVEPAEGRYVVKPAAVGTFTYTLQPENEEGSPLPTFELTVNVRPTWADDPALSNVRANPASIKLGESSALQWTPREDVAKVVVKLPDGTTKEVEPAEGRYVVKPAAVGAFTYTLQPENEEGSPLPTFELTVNVRPTWADDPALSNVRANPASIKLGESSALQWTPREDVAKVVVKLPDGTTKEVEPAEGRYVVKPAAVGAFTYTLQPENEEGSPLPTFELTVNVRPTWADDPALSNVRANPASIKLGESSALQWTPREDVAKVVVKLPDGTTKEVEPAEGRYVVKPAAVGAFTYTLQPENEEGSPLPTFELTVNVRPTWADDPALTDVRANPASIKLGESSALQWTPREDVAKVVVKLPDGTTKEVEPAEGRYVVKPAAVGAFTYTLQPENEEGSPLPTFELTVNVRPTWADDPALSNVRANPASIKLGESSALQWTPREDVAKVVVKLPDGTTKEVEPAEGRYVVKPAAVGAFTYKLEPENEEGSPLPTFELTVNVRPTWADDPALTDVRANPASIKLGESSALQWTPREDVAKVVVKLPDGTTKEVEPAEGRYVVTPAAVGTFTYKLEAYDEEDALLLTGGPFEATVAVTVPKAPVPLSIFSFTINGGASARIQVGEAVTLRWTLTGDAARNAIIELNYDGKSEAVADGNELHDTTMEYTIRPQQTGEIMLVVTNPGDAGDKATASVAVTVEEPNRAPVAGDDIVEVKRGGSVTIKAVALLANDTDADDDTLTLTSVGGAVNGKVSLSGTTITYTHDGGKTTTGSFTYTVSDGNGGSDTATVKVSVIDEKVPRLGRVNEAVLPELSRAMVSGALEAVTRRIEAAGSGRSGTGRQSIAGHASLHEALRANEKALSKGTMDWKRALAGSSFSLVLGATEDGASPGMPGGLTFWGDGDWRALSGGDSTAPVEWEGDVRGARLGVDAQLRPDLLAGLMLSRSQGEVDWTDHTDRVKGTQESGMTSLHPYVGWWSGKDAGLWASVGYGRGKVEIDDEETGQQSSDSALKTAAVGGHARLFSDDGVIAKGTTVLTLKGEAWLSRFEMEDDGDRIKSLTVDTNRLRLGLEGSHERRLADDGVLRPSLEVGLRHDGGDGETGAGVELGGSLSWTDAVRGLTVEGRLRTLLTHRSDDLEEWGVGGSVRLDPGADRRGLSLALSPSWGAAQSGLARLWEDGPLSDRSGEAASDPGAALNAEIGYGLSAVNGRGVLTPYGGLSLSDDGARDYRLGGRLEIGPSLMLSLDGKHSESATGAADLGLMLRGAARW